MISTGALAVGIGEITMGLSCETVFADIEKYVPIGLQAFSLVIGLLDPPLAATLTPIINDVKAALSDVVAAINAYQDAPASDKATLLGKISLVINVAIQAIQQFWSSLNLPDGNLLNTIESILQIILATLSSFLPSLGAVVLPLNARTFAKSIPYTPTKPKNSKALKAQLNAVFTTNGYKLQVVY